MSPIEFHVTWSKVKVKLLMFILIICAVYSISYDPLLDGCQPSYKLLATLKTKLKVKSTPIHSIWLILEIWNCPRFDSDIEYVRSGSQEKSWGYALCLFLILPTHSKYRNPKSKVFVEQSYMLVQYLINNFKENCEKIKKKWPQ